MVYRAADIKPISVRFGSPGPGITSGKDFPGSPAMSGARRIRAASLQAILTVEVHLK
jgi:hypothetical protein